MRLLFVKEALAWPRSSGHDVHCFYMMQALAQLGHEVSLITANEPSPEALGGLPFRLRRTFADGAGNLAGARPLSLSRLQERFRSYWGIDPARIEAVERTAQECRADAVVVVGLNVLPYLGAVSEALRVWYAADEWAWHHLSQVRLLRTSTWGNVKAALIKGLYERVYAPLVDRVWMVSEADRRAMRWVAGVRGVDMIPYGLDGDIYRPQGQPQSELSCVFWGRLDFGPNIQAVEWFCQRVWPSVRVAVPKARFSIFGFNPTPAIIALSGRDGITVVPDLPDLRAEVDKHQVVVLPMVSGGGVKNKMLEAAGMGKAIICSPKACGGLVLPEALPFIKVRSPGQWVDAITALWGNPDRRQRLGEEARRWVLNQHSWQAAAGAAAAGLEQSIREAAR